MEQYCWRNLHAFESKPSSLREHPDDNHTNAFIWRYGQFSIIRRTKIIFRQVHFGLIINKFARRGYHLRVKFNETAHKYGLMLREVNRGFGSLQTFELL